MLIDIWPGDWDNQLETINMRVDEDNELSMVKGRIRKVLIFKGIIFVGALFV